MTSGTDADISALRAELAQLRTDFAKIAGTLQDLARHGKSEFAEKAQDSAQRLQDEMKRRTQTVTELIEERPVASALTSFAVGMVFGTLVSGRRT
ncbi:MAG: hypothetical protein EPO08_04735 [Rhodospirillaceae bacterium]|nr:MAG: hypothetical protein EPO08_04735 [Rhodospirillaceae bacterium]